MRGAGLWCGKASLLPVLGSLAVLLSLPSGVRSQSLDCSHDATVPDLGCIFYGSLTLSRDSHSVMHPGGWDHYFSHAGTLTIASNASVRCAEPLCSLRVVAAATLRVHGTVEAGLLQLEAGQDVDLVGSSVVASGLGSVAGAGAGKTVAGGSGGGGGFGGKGAPGCDGTVPAAGGNPYSGYAELGGTMFADVWTLPSGSGGGNGEHQNGATAWSAGRSGGSVVIDAGGVFKMSLSASVMSNGADGAGDPNGWVSASGGGGSGGMVVIRADSWSEGVAGGSIVATGGGAESGGVSGDGDGGAGSGGRVLLLATSGSDIPPSIVVQVDGGRSSCGAAFDGVAAFVERGGARHCQLNNVSHLWECACADDFADPGVCTQCSVASNSWGPTCSWGCPDCGVHGSCSRATTGSGCTCHVGWGGDRCNVCDAGYFGTECDTLCPFCGDHASCIDGRAGSGECQCDIGWAGDASLAQCDRCAAGFFGSDCAGRCAASCIHGTCDEGIGGTGACLCDTGWSGQSCDACAPGYFGANCSSVCNCDAHGICEDGQLGRGCLCESNWQQTAVNQPCNDCAVGFFGPNCTACMFGDCGLHGECDDGVGGRGGCICDTNWDGERCLDCDATHFGPGCSGNCPTCDSRLTCASGIDGSGACGCAGGWRGATCTECGPGFQGAGCDICAPGYYGRHCLECRCGDHGTCDDGDQGAGGCACDSGWTGDLCDECVADHYGPTCRACQDCSSIRGSVCDDGPSGSGACICVDDGLPGISACCSHGKLGSSCELVDAEAVCRVSPPHATHPSVVVNGSSVLHCQPHVMSSLSHGYDMLKGTDASQPTFAFGFADPEGRNGVDEWRGWRVPTDVSVVELDNNIGADAIDPSEAATPTEATLLVTNARQAQTEVARRVGISLDGALPDGALTRQAAFTSLVGSLAAHQFSASVGHVHHSARFTGPIGQQGGNMPHFSLEFREAVAILPTTYESLSDRAAYRRLITTFGTHVAESIVIGGRASSTLSATLCGPLNKLVNVQDGVSAVENSLRDPAVDIRRSAQSHWTFLPRGITQQADGGDESEFEASGVAAWTSTVDSSPVVVERHLVGLDEAVALLTSSTTATKAPNTAQAIVDYLDEGKGTAIETLGSAFVSASDASATVDVPTTLEGMILSPDSSPGAGCAAEPLPEGFVSVAAASSGSLLMSAALLTFVVSAIELLL